MKCQNCGENEANVRYTQIINGVKKQMNLCENCAKELGIDKINFDMSAGFSDMWNEMFDMYNDMMFGFPLESNRLMLNEFSNDVAERVNTNKTAIREKSSVREDIERFKNRKAKEVNNSNNTLEVLKKRLQQEIKEERFEDAAKTRDEIRKLEQ